jgi:hypothetical protein
LSDPPIGVNVKLDKDFRRFGRFTLTGLRRISILAG